MGLDIELLMMDVPCGSSVYRVSRSPGYTFPTSISTFITDIIPLLELTWAGK
ncbi:unnamed protein product [Cunninghamella blakesleeana]